MEMYAHYRARLGALTASETPEQEFQEALKGFVEEVRRDLENLAPRERALLSDDLGLLILDELSGKFDQRERRAIQALRGVIDYAKTENYEK